MKKINLIMLVLFSWNAFAQVPFQLGNDIQNRKVVLFQGTTDNHQYFGFGINPSLLRYQVDSPSSSHAFFSGASASESNELMRITGIGYVGIGISSPNAPLQFANTTANRKLVLYEVANNDNQYFGLGINAGMFRYQVDNSSSVHAFYAGASSTTSNELMRITGTGNVGIGTTAPSEKLHVAGSVRIVDGTQAAGRVLTSDANGRGTWTTPAAGGNTSELQKITEGSNTGWRILGNNSANYGDIGVSAVDLSRSTSASSTRGATGQDAFATGFETTASGASSTSMGNKSTATGTNAVAIGSNSIASGFNSIASGFSTRATEDASTAMGNFTRATGIFSTASGDEVRAKSFGEFAIGSYNDTLTTVNPITFAGDNNRIFTVGTGTSATRRTSFVVQQNGNVGIGASTPNAQLQLGNSITNRKLVLYEVANNDHQYYGLGINASMLRYQVDNTISSHAFYAATSNTTSNELMRISGTGNVGIGTTAPSERLHVAGSVRIVDGTEGVGKVLTSDANGKGTWTTPAAASLPTTLTNIQKLQFATTFSNRRVVFFDPLNNDNQYVGLGIDFDMLRYQVDGDLSSHVFFAGASSSTSTELMRIDGNGKVGIGTNVPSEKFHVAGSVRIVDGTQGAGKVLTSDANGKASWATPAAAGNNSELQKITEGGKTGWRILGRNAANFGDIGQSAIDLSDFLLTSTTNGATGTYSLATGYNSTASGGVSTAMGSTTVASGHNSTALGGGTKASGLGSTAMGINTIASGNWAIAMGSSTVASGRYATAMGNETVASGSMSTATGDGTIAKSFGEFVTGSYNDTLTTADPLGIVSDYNRIFTVGIGTVGLRKTGFVIQQNGNVGIGSSTPIEKLHVIGNILASGTVTQFSDLRYKKNFSKIENPLNKVLALNGLHYDWKVEEFKENNFTKDRQIGFIAQEIEKIFPEMVLTDSKGYKSVDYARLTPVLVEAIKELKTLNDELKEKDQKLEARLNKIEALLYKY